MSATVLILLSIFMPLTAGLVLRAFDKEPNIRDGFSLLVAASTFVCVCSLTPQVMAGERPAFELVEMLPGLSIAFEIEPLGMLFALIASGLWIITTLYAIGYMRGHHEANQTRFFTCFAVAIGAAVGAAFSANLLTLFVCYELLSVSTFPLVAHHQSAESRKAGRIYLGILLTSSVLFFLPAIVWTWHLTGTTDFVAGGILMGKISDGAVPLLLALFIFGAGKAAVMPLHRWLPAAMVAPTPVSALLHAVAVVKVGVFTVVKVVTYTFGTKLLTETGGSIWLMYVASFTILAASVVALGKDNLKARLAYSTISQLSYIVLGAAFANELGILGAGFHIAMHAMGKITLFFAAGALIVLVHKTEISDMAGIGRKMPWTMGAFFVGSLCIIGIPPTGGSWSKWYLLMSAADANVWLMGVLLISSLFSIGYLMPVVTTAFFKPLPPETDHHHDDHHDEHHHGGSGNVEYDHILCVIPPVLTAAGCVLLFLFSDQLYALLEPIMAANR
ncbi:MAG: proton-conducting transporter membrane subunit [Myxococcota bacterium]|nr:proton-conducting transporter membrane subunit [Myxococcota bacterium]